MSGGRSRPTRQGNLSVAAVLNCWISREIAVRTRLRFGDGAPREGRIVDSAGAGVAALAPTPVSSVRRCCIRSRKAPSGMFAR